jgi:glutathione S-transferase
MPEARLVTIACSHYCEKARWALDYAGVAYREEPHVPLLHVPYARPGRSVPVLHWKGAIYTDSTRILQALDAELPAARSLYPTAAALAWEERLDEELGPWARIFAYCHVAPEPDVLRLLFAHQLRPREATILRFGAPLLGAFLRTAFRVSEKSAVRSRERLLRTFDAVEAERAGKPFLLGDTFSAADLTFAALASPVLAPAEFTHPWPTPEQLPPRFVAALTELRAHPAGQFALGLFAGHRGLSANSL